jgi:hypothetical protein
MPAGSQNARLSTGKEPKRVGAAGTRGTSSPGGLIDARRRHHPRQNRCVYPRP